MGRRQTCIVLGVLLIGVGLLLTTVAVADEPPPPPDAYYGNVTVDGEPAPAGIEIVAEIDGDVRGTIVTDESGTYGEASATGEKLVVEGDEDDVGKPVTFRVNGETATTTPDTVKWESGGLSEVDLEIDGPSAADYTDTDGVVDIDGLRKAISDWAAGEIDIELLREVIDAWATGEPIIDGPAPQFDLENLDGVEYAANDSHDVGVTLTPGDGYDGDAEYRVAMWVTDDDGAYVNLADRDGVSLEDVFIPTLGVDADVVGDSMNQVFYLDSSVDGATLSDADSAEAHLTLAIDDDESLLGTYDFGVELVEWDEAENESTDSVGTPTTATFEVVPASDLLQYADNDGVIRIDGLREAIDDWAAGEIDIDLLREVIDAWASGEQV